MSCRHAPLLSIVVATASACSAPLDAFADGTLRMDGRCRGPVVDVRLEPPEGSCPGLDRPPTLITDGDEATLSRGTQRVGSYDDIVPIPRIICDAPAGRGRLTGLGAEHTLTIEHDDVVIAARFQLPDTILACDGIAECTLFLVDVTECDDDAFSADES
jgi:hypothetical protein